MLCGELEWFMPSQTVPIQNMPCRAKSIHAKSKSAGPGQIKMLRHGMFWHGTARLFVAWHVASWHGTWLHGTARGPMAQPMATWHGTARHGHTLGL